MTMIVLNATETRIGLLPVRRILPNHPVRMIGPFVFTDQMGPVRVDGQTDIDVRPHPHIGLATMTWLFEGALLHRDSVGSVQPILPSEVNWMTAGRGIVHSERRLPADAGRPVALEGVQVWVGLPQAMAECEPGFAHHRADALPRLERDGCRITVIAGHAFGERSPVEIASPLGYAAIELAPGSRLTIEADHPERALYLVSGTVDVDGQQLAPGQMAVLPAGEQARLRADTPARAMLLAGTPLDGPRYLSWNFVSHDRDRLARARADWAADRFPRIPDDQDERIELPGPRTAK